MRREIYVSLLCSLQEALSKILRSRDVCMVVQVVDGYFGGRPEVKSYVVDEVVRL